MKSLVFLSLAMFALPYSIRAQTSQPLFFTFSATASGAQINPFNPYLSAQIDSLNVRINGVGTANSWTAQIQTSPDNVTWTNCGSSVTATAASSNSGGACTPVGALYVRVNITAGSGGGTLNGTLMGTCSLCQLTTLINGVRGPYTFTGAVTQTGSTFNFTGGSGTFVTLSGDAISTATGGATTVVGIEGHAIAAPSTAAFVHWSGSAWEYTNPSGSGTVTTSGSPVSPNVACFSSSTAITSCTSANVQTAIGSGVYQAPLNLLAGTYVNGDMCTYASSGTLLNCNTAVPTAYTLPTATSSTLGGVKPDGTTISNSSGAISVANPYNPASVTITGGTIDGTVIGGTTPAAGTFTSIAATGSGAGSFTATAGTAPTGAAGKAIYSTDATVGYAEVNENNTGLSRVCTAANGQCSGGTVNTGTATYFSYYATTGTTIGPDLNWLDNGTHLVAAEPISAPSISATTQLTVGGGTAGSPTQISNTATPISALPAASTLAPSTVGSNTQYYYRWILDGTTANDCTAGGGANLHWCYSNGTSWIVSSSSYILPAQYTITPCSVTLTNNGSAISSATYSVVFNGSCLNDFGATYTIAHASVYSDNGSGSSTCSATDNSSNAVLSASTAANASWLNNADSNISGTHFTIASGAWLNFSIFADGTSKTIKCVLTTTR